MAAAADFERFASLAGIQAAWPTPQGFLVRRGQRDIRANKGRSTLQAVSLSAEDGLAATSFPMELRDVSVCAPSPSGRLLAQVRTGKHPDSGKEQRFIEVWDGERLISQTDVTSVHGKVLKDDWFYGFDWSQDEARIAYVAEPTAPKTTSFFAPKKTKKEGEGEKEDEEEAGAQFRYREDWGEKYVGVTGPQLYLLDVAAQSSARISGVPEGVSAGQVVFHPDGESVCFTGWPQSPRRLGIIYCYQRPCRIYRLALAEGSEALPISPEEDVIARSARFSPDGTQLAYLASDAIATHNNCFALKALDVASGAARTVVPVVHVPEAGEDSFPGVFCGKLPQRCWTADGSAVVFTSQWRTAVAAVHVSMASGQVTRLAAARDAVGAVAVLCVCDGGVLVVESGPCSPGQLVLYRLGGATGAAVTSTLPGPVPACPDDVAGMFWSVLTVDPRDGSGQAFEAFLLSAGADEPEKRPLVVVPHGGPHSCYPTSFSFAHAFLVSQGYAVLCVNFRGSTGFGRTALESLPGRCGTQDITDVEDAVVAALTRYAEHLDERRMAVCGGSHGGFIAGHLIGQQPQLFKSAVLRNPVCDVVSMTAHTDIPDWCFVECGLPYDFNSYRSPTPEELAVMRAASPMAYVDRVQCPTLFTIGAKDRRVPPLVGMDFHQVLRARGLESSVLWYPEDCHAIDSPASEADAWVNIAGFLARTV